jgi:tripartite-type tricarboxylate transporter receptor subunit TctC
MPPKEFADFLRQEIQTWNAVAKQAGVKAE